MTDEIDTPALVRFRQDALEAAGRSFRQGLQAALEAEFGVKPGAFVEGLEAAMRQYAKEEVDLDEAARKNTNRELAHQYVHPVVQQAREEREAEERHWDQLALGQRSRPRHEAPEMAGMDRAPLVILQRGTYVSWYEWKAQQRRKEPHPTARRGYAWDAYLQEPDE